MSAATSNTAACELLNELLVDLARSLLQYACEASPWEPSRNGETLRNEILNLGAEQRVSVEALGQLLNDEGQVVDFGVFPPEYTSLHYVSAGYLLNQLIAGEAALVAECQRIWSQLPENTLAADLVYELLQREQMILRDLQALQSQQPTA